MINNQPPKKRTLIIGGGGFIGANLIPALIASGRHITVIGRSPAPQNQLPQVVDYVGCDFAQPDVIGSLLGDHQEVIHLAYASVPNTSFDSPLLDLLQNLSPAVQLFSEAAHREVKLLLVSSGGTVYGEAVSLPICENHQTKPISSYGVTKLTLENYARLFAATHNLNFVCVRPSNAFGVGQRPFAGQGFVSTAMASVMRGKPINIFGPKGTIRDYLHASDLASGIVSALDFGLQAETYNLGSGVGLSNLDVVELIAPLMEDIGLKVAVQHLEQRPFDVKVNILDSSKLKLHTGWGPKIDFIDGLRSTRDWLMCELDKNKK